MKTVTLLATAIVLASPLAAVAQEPPPVTAEHEALALWIGDWSGSGQMQPGPFGPGGAMEWTEECSWFADARFHVVCRSEGTSPTGPMRGLGIIGYDAAKKVYTHYGVDNGGWSGYSEGTRTGDTWTFTSTETVEGKTYHSRFTMEMESAGKMTFGWEMSEDGKSWTTMMDGTSEKR